MRVKEKILFSASKKNDRTIGVSALVGASRGNRKVFGNLPYRVLVSINLTRKTYVVIQWKPALSYQYYGSAKASRVLVVPAAHLRN